MELLKTTVCTVLVRRCQTFWPVAGDRLFGTVGEAKNGNNRLTKVHVEEGH